MEDSASEIFNISPKTYAAARARQYAGALTAALALPLTAALIAGFYDVRWWFVGLMVIFIIFPMVLTMAWFSLTGSPSMALLLRPQRWTFRDDRKIDIEFFRFDLEENPAPIERRTVAIRDVSPGSRYAIFKAAKNQSFHILLIPVELLPAEYINLYSEC